MNTYEQQQKEVMDMLSSLRDEMSIERIAVEIGKGYHTIWRWMTGKGMPDKGDHELIKELYRKLIKKNA